MLSNFLYHFHTWNVITNLFLTGNVFYYYAQISNRLFWTWKSGLTADGSLYLEGILIISLNMEIQATPPAVAAAAAATAALVTTSIFITNTFIQLAGLFEQVRTLFGTFNYQWFVTLSWLSFSSNKAHDKLLIHRGCEDVLYVGPLRDYNDSLRRLWTSARLCVHACFCVCVCARVSVCVCARAEMFDHAGDPFKCLPPCEHVAHHWFLTTSRYHATFVIFSPFIQKES